MDLCCKKPIIEYYSISNHLFDDLTNKKLTNLLWCLPEIDSYKAEINSIYSKEIYDEVFIELFMKEIGLESKDIFIDTCPKQNMPIIDRTTADYFKDKICTNCQKLVFFSKKNKTRISQLFSHLRNMIAHGCFDITDNYYFIGFDHPRFNGIEYTAVAKLDFEKMNKVLTELIKINTLPKLFKYLLERIGYRATDLLEDQNDLLVNKDGFYFYLIFREFTGRYIKQSDIQLFIDEYRHFDKKDCIYVLVVDSTYSNAKINQFVVNEHISILDKKFVKELVEKRDVLQELKENIY